MLFYKARCTPPRYPFTVVCNYRDDPVPSPASFQLALPVNDSSHANVRLVPCASWLLQLPTRTLLSDAVLLLLYSNHSNKQRPKAAWLVCGEDSLGKELRGIWFHLSYESAALMQGITMTTGRCVDRVPSKDHPED